jgi:hypothetical protein
MDRDPRANELANLKEALANFEHQLDSVGTSSCPLRLPARKNANDFFDAMARLNYPSARDFTAPLTLFAKTMPPYTLKEKARITAGAVTALVIVAWLVILALALLSA